MNNNRNKNNSTKSERRALGVETEILVDDREPLSEWGYCLYRSPFPPAGRALGLDQSSECEDPRARRSVTKIVGPMGSVYEIRSHR